MSRHSLTVGTQVMRMRQGKVQRGTVEWVDDGGVEVSWNGNARRTHYSNQQAGTLLMCNEENQLALVRALFHQ